jgi:hypothetical protein
MSITQNRRPTKGRYVSREKATGTVRAQSWKQLVSGSGQKRKSAFVIARLLCPQYRTPQVRPAGLKSVNNRRHGHLTSRTLTRNPDHESSSKRPSFPLSSDHDDRARRTRTEDTRAKRSGQAHPCGPRRRDFPDPARARERLPGRLAVVFLDRLSTGIFDQHRHQSLGVFRRLDGNGRHTLAERIACCAFCPAAAGRRYQRRVRTGQRPMASCEVVPAATERADTSMPLIASAFASYSAAHPRYRFGHDD